MSFNKKLEQDLPGLSADTESQIFDIDEFLFVSGQVSWENGAGFSATISFEVSNDKENWAIVGASTANVSGATGTHIMDLANTATSYVRIKIENVAGTADANIDITSKSIKFNR